jgi:hypothetical protein
MTNQIVLTKEIAEAYLAREGEFDYLRWYTEISNDATQALATYQGDLFLDGLTMLSDWPGNVALLKHLEQQYGEYYLNNLTKLSDVAAEALAKYSGHLFLDGLTALSDAAAQELAKFRGAKQTKDRGHLYFGVDLELSDIAAKALGKYCRRRSV